MQNKSFWKRNKKIEAILKILTNETEEGPNLVSIGLSYQSVWLPF